MAYRLPGTPWRPTDMKRSSWNSVCVLLGAACYADTLAQFVGIVLLMEALLVSIEGCWLPGADGDDNETEA